jgi:hypothetical protein
MRPAFSRFISVLAVAVAATLVVPANAWAIPPDHAQSHAKLKKQVNVKDLPGARRDRPDAAAPRVGKPQPSLAAPTGAQAPVIGRQSQGGKAPGPTATSSAPTAQVPQSSPGVLEQLKAFDGLGPDCCTPPDTQVAVGPDSVVEMVNTTGRTTNKAGGDADDFNLSDFFGAPVNAMNQPRYSDPRVIYDDLSDRYFASILIFDGCDGCASEDDSEVDIAVSGSNQPTGWSVYVVATYTDGTLADQPKLGVSSDKAVMTWNNNGFSGPYQFVVLQKSDLVAQLQNVGTFFFALDTDHFNVIPVMSMSPTNTEFAVSANQNSSTLTLTAFTGTPNAGNVAKTHQDFSIGTYSTPPGAVQPNDSRTLDTGVAAVQSAMWDNGLLWAAGNTSCTPPNDSQQRACLRLDRLTTSGTTGTLQQDINIGQNGAHLFYPAVMTDAGGNLFIGHSVSSSTQFGTAGMSFAPIGNIPSTVGGIDYRIGAGPYNCTFCYDDATPPNPTDNRWGDYSGAARDPSNPWDVWFAEEWGSTSTTNTNAWGTAIGRFTQAPPTVTGVSPNSGPEQNTACAPTVTVTGTDFVTNQTSVSFGATPASSVTVNTPETLTAVAPSHVAGAVDVTVTTPAGTSDTNVNDQFTYIADTTAPVSTASPSPAPLAGNDGWTKGPVTVGLSADDGTCGSGVQSVTYFASGAQNIPFTTVPGSSTSFSITNEGVTTVTFYAIDNAGNVESVKTLTVKIDNTAPRVAFATPPAGEPYLLNQPVAASYSCIDRVDGIDGGVGVATCNGPVPVGSTITTSPVGTYTFTVNTADKLANATSQSTTYHVTYKICLQYDPTKPSGGRGYVFTVQICDYNNINMSIVGIHLTATAVDGDPAKAKPLGNLNPGNVFLYGPGTAPGANYLYNLDTNGLSSGSHLLYFTVEGDPVVHSIPFILK